MTRRRSGTNALDESLETVEAVRPYVGAVVAAQSVSNVRESAPPGSLAYAMRREGGAQARDESSDAYELPRVGE